MKKFYKYLFLGFSLVGTSVATFASIHEPSIGIQVFEKPEPKEETPRGCRTPSLPIECTIDFENHCIELSSSEFILAYELWDEDGTYVIGSNASDSEFVDFISGLSGVYQLRLIGVEHVYVGYLEF